MGTQNNTDALAGSGKRNPGWNTQESVSAALEQTKGKVKTAARLLGVSEASLRHRITELKLSANGHVAAVVDHFRSPLYGLDILRPEKWEEKRPCWYCGAVFSPQRPNNWDQHFCKDEHKTLFNKYGYLPFDKLLAAVKMEIQLEVKAIILESLVERAISKMHPRLMGVIRASETKHREYVRKTVASMLDNPERVQKKLTGAQSQADAADSGETAKSGGEQVGPRYKNKGFC